MVAVLGAAELITWSGPSEGEVRQEICDDSLPKRLQEYEQSPEYKAAEKKSPGERTVRERTVFEAVEYSRAEIERCS